MTFAWYGFALEHPEDWAPITLSGNRQEGYVRIASPGRHSFQIRWKESGRNLDPSVVLSSYLDRLKNDAKRAKVEFRSDVEAEQDRMTYRYASTIHGRGALLQPGTCGRVFFLEAISSKNDSLLPVFRKLLDSFSVGEDKERWALFGLNLILPPGLEVVKKVLLSGRTQLGLGAKGVQIEAQRWGLAEQLIAKHGLEAWARSVMELSSPQSIESGEGIEFLQKGSLLKAPTYAMAQVQPNRNQVTTVKVVTKDETWRPTWDWFK